jgi:uncharacterized protein (TIGR02271 family)
VPVQEERVVIEQRPGSGRLIVGDRELQMGETVDLPLMRERVVVSKKPVIAEEVVVRKQAAQHTEQFREIVRREDLSVNDPTGRVLDNGVPHPDGGSGQVTGGRPAN